MKILQIVPRIPSPPSDGGAYYVYQNTLMLKKLGHSITMLGFISNRHKQDINDISKYVTLHSVDGEFKPYGFKAVLKSLITFIPISAQHRMDPQKMKCLINQVSEKPDIILLEGIQTAVFLPLLRNKFPDVRIILRQVNVEHLLLKRNAETTKNIFIKSFYHIQKLLMKKFELNAMNKADAVTAITEYDKNIFLKHLPNLSCFVSPVPIIMPKDLSVKRKSNTLLAISNWKWKPNYDGLKWFLVNVWPELISIKPELSFDIIGEGLTNSFKEKFKSESVSFLGYIDDLEPFRQSSTIFVAPLFSGSGMKVKIVESMASGIPIVTTDIGAEGINIKDGFHYLKANTAADFKNRIVSLLDSKELKSSIGKNAKSFALSEFNSDKLAKELTDFLKV